MAGAAASHCECTVTARPKCVCAEHSCRSDYVVRDAARVLGDVTRSYFAVLYSLAMPAYAAAGEAVFMELTLTMRCAASIISSAAAAAMSPELNALMLILTTSPRSIRSKAGKAGALPEAGGSQHHLAPSLHHGGCPQHSEARQHEGARNESRTDVTCIYFCGDAHHQLICGPNKLPSADYKRCVEPLPWGKTLAGRCLATHRCPASFAAAAAARAARSPPAAPSTRQSRRAAAAPTDCTLLTAVRRPLLRRGLLDRRGQPSASTEGPPARKESRSSSMLASEEDDEQQHHMNAWMRLGGIC